MSTFTNVMRDTILENISNLVKVKIKLDPAQYHPNKDLNEIDEYVGYVLQEFDDGSFDVFVPDAELEEPIIRMMLPNMGQETPSRYSYLKQMIIDELPKKGVNADETVAAIEEADCIHVLEDIMKFNNFAESEIIEMLKEYISETESTQ